MDSGAAQSDTLINEAANIYFFVHNLAKEISQKVDILYRGEKVVRTNYGN